MALLEGTAQPLGAFLRGQETSTALWRMAVGLHAGIVTETTTAAKKACYRPKEDLRIAIKMLRWCPSNRSLVHCAAFLG